MCVTLRLYFSCFISFFPFKMLSVLVCFVLFLFFSWSSDSVSSSKHGHSSLYCTKRKFALRQTAKKQELTTKNYWNENPIGSGWMILPDTRYTQCEEFWFSPIGGPSCAFSQCKKSGKGTCEDLHLKWPTETLLRGLGVQEEQWYCGQWMKLPSWQISKHKIMCNIAFQLSTSFCVVFINKRKKNVWKINILFCGR